MCSILCKILIIEMHIRYYVKKLYNFKAKTDLIDPWFGSACGGGPGCLLGASGKPLGNLWGASGELLGCLWEPMRACREPMRASGKPLGALFCYTTFYYTIIYDNILYFITVHYTPIYCTMLGYTVLCSTMLWYATQSFLYCCDYY